MRTRSMPKFACPDSSEGARQPTSTTLRAHLASKTTAAHLGSLSSCTLGLRFCTSLRITKPEESKTQTTILPDIPPDVEVPGTPIEFRKATVPELVEELERMHQVQQGAQYLSIRARDVEQEGSYDVHAPTVA
jgi:hypothetical protein